MAMTPEIRNLMLQEGDQQALSLSGGNSANSAAGKFSMALMQMLKQYQTLGTKNIQQENIGYQQEQAGRISAQTPQDLIGAAPSIQAGVRGAEASALNPSIEGSATRAKTLSEQISGLGNAISQAGAIGQWMQEMETNTKTEARNLIMNNTDAVKSMPDKERTALLKQAGIEQSFLDAMPSSTAETKTQVIDLGNNKKALINSLTGDIIKEYGGGAEAEGGTSIFDELEMKNTIDSLVKNNSGIKSAVGPTMFGRIGLDERLSGARQNFIAGVEQLVSQLSLDSLITAKAAGATFGALSDTEMRVLASSATKIGTWRIRDKNGNTTGYAIDEESFKKELNNIKNLIEKSSGVGGSGENDLEEYNKYLQMFNQ